MRRRQTRQGASTSTGRTEGSRRSRLRAGLRALSGQFKPARIAAAAAALGIILASLAGALDSVERRLSDAWFSFGNLAPSGRIVLVSFDRGAAARYSNAARVPHFDLADLLLKLDAAGATRILVEVSLAEQASEADDKYLERVLTQLGRKVAVSMTAVLTGNQVGWRRVGPLDRFARHIVRTASDLALDGDGELRQFGIAESGLRSVVSSPAWLNGADADRNAAQEPDAFRIDFGIDLRRIPVVDAVSILQGKNPNSAISGASVIVAGFPTLTGTGFRVPRYGELTRPQVTALAAETLARGRNLQPVPHRIFIGLMALAAFIALCCVRLSARKGAVLCAGAALAVASGAAWLQVSAGLMAPAAGAIAAVVLGYAAAQVAVHPAFRRLRLAGNTLMAGIDVRLARVLDHTAHGLLTFDRDGKVLSINSAASRLLGVEPKRDTRALSLPAILGPQADAVLGAVRDQHASRTQTVLHQGAARRWLELAVNAVAGEGGWTGVATVRDVTEQHAQIEALSRIACQDPLTGLRNRRAFEEGLRQACAGAAAPSAHAPSAEVPFALLLCDLDGFKQVNDTLGHAAGDVLLREIAFRLVVETKPHGIVARLGGDEFAILLQPSTQTPAAATAQRLVDAVARAIRIGTEEVAVGVSIGIALGSRTQKAPVLDPKALMASADAAMYEAKRQRTGYGFAPAGGEPAAATPPSSNSAEVVPLRQAG